MADEKRLNTKMITPEIVCSYPSLHEKGEDLSGRLAYSMAIHISKQDPKAKAQLQQIMANAAVNAWGEKYKTLKGITHFVEDTDTLEDVGDRFKGTLKFSAKSQKRQPGLVYPNRERVPQELIETTFYPGCIVLASVSAYGTDSGGKKTVAFSLNNVMWVRDGEPLGSVSNPDDDFADHFDDSFTLGGPDPFRDPQDPGPAGGQGDLFGGAADPGPEDAGDLFNSGGPF